MMEALFRKHQVCAIMRAVPFEDAHDYAQAAFDGGIRMFEIALNSADALRQITMLRECFGDRALVGAGTAIGEARARAACDAGAQFLLTPSANRETLAFCQKNELPLLPGVMTPTDVDLCLQYGFSTLKLFPAGDLPSGYIKSLRGPFENTEYVAVGGVNAGNLATFFRQGFIGVGIGLNLFPKDCVAKKDWAGAAQAVGEMMKQLPER